MYKLIPFIIIILTITSNSFSQNKADISFIYNSTSTNRINIEYRLPIKEQLKLTMGVVIGSNNNFGNVNHSRYIFVSDSIITRRVNAYTTFQSGLKIGFDRLLMNPLFSFGADFLIAYRKERLWIYNDSYIHIDSTNSWVPGYHSNYEAYHPEYNFSGNSKVKREYIVPQLQLTFSMNIPIVEGLFLNLFVGGLASSPILIKESSLFDPGSEFTPSGKLQKFEMTSQAGMGLRFSLGNEKVFTPKNTN